MNIIQYLNEHPLVGPALILVLFFGFIIGFVTYSKVSFGKLGSLDSFLKKDSYYYVCEIIGEAGDNPIWIIKKVTLNGTNASYSRKFYLRPHAVAPFNGIPLKTIFKIDSKEYYISGEVSEINVSIPQFGFSGIPSENLKT